MRNKTIGFRSAIVLLFFVINTGCATHSDQFRAAIISRWRYAPLPGSVVGDIAATCLANILQAEFEAAFPFCKRAAVQGDATAQYLFGLMYYLPDHGLEPDLAEATKWFRKSAEQGNAFGQAVLGNMYVNGIGVKQDFVEATHWLRKSAEQGNAFGQAFLGVMYGVGSGVKQDQEQGVKWMSRSAKQGNAFGQAFLGGMYANGHGVKRDYAEAARWFRKSADQGNAFGQAFLGNMYVNGMGVKQSFPEAVRWLSKAAEQGDARAREKLTLMATEQGLPEANFALGELYSNGLVVHANGSIAATYYYKAGLAYLGEGKRENLLICATRIDELSSKLNLNVLNADLSTLLRAELHPERE